METKPMKIAASLWSCLWLTCRVCVFQLFDCLNDPCPSTSRKELHSIMQHCSPSVCPFDLIHLLAWNMRNTEQRIPLISHSPLGARVYIHTFIYILVSCWCFFFLFNSALAVCVKCLWGSQLSQSLWRSAIRAASPHKCYQPSPWGCVGGWKVGRFIQVAFIMCGPDIPDTHVHTCTHSTQILVIFTELKKESMRLKRSYRMHDIIISYFILGISVLECKPSLDF